MQNKVSRQVTQVGTQLTKFIIIGVGSTAIDFGVMYLLIEGFSTHYLVASTMAFIIATVFNYYFSILWVFKSKYTNKKDEFLVFTGLSVLGLLLTQVLLYISVSIVGLQVFVSKVGVTGVVTIINFILRKRVIE